MHNGSAPLRTCGDVIATGSPDIDATGESYVLNNTAWRAQRIFGAGLGLPITIGYGDTGAAQHRDPTIVSGWVSR